MEKKPFDSGSNDGLVLGLAGIARDGSEHEILAITYKVSVFEGDSTPLDKWLQREAIPDARYWTRDTSQND